jgi:hypothetical protein
MNTQASEIDELKLRVAELEKQVAQLQAQLAQRSPRVVREAPAVVARPLTSKELWAKLLTKGIIRLPTSAELELSKEWRELPEAEKEATRRTLRSLKLEPSLSEIIHKMRDGWYPDTSEWVNKP